MDLNGTPQPALCLPSPASPQLLQKVVGHGGGQPTGGQSEWSGWLEGSCGLSSSLVLRPQCGLTGSKGEEVALCERAGGQGKRIHEPVATCKDPCHLVEG